MTLLRHRLAQLNSGTTNDASTIFAGETFHVVRGHRSLYEKHVPIEEALLPNSGVTLARVAFGERMKISREFLDQDPRAAVMTFFATLGDMWRLFKSDDPNRMQEPGGMVFAVCEILAQAGTAAQLPFDHPAFKTLIAINTIEHLRRPSARPKIEAAGIVRAMAVNFVVQAQGHVFGIGGGDLTKTDIRELLAAAVNAHFRSLIGSEISGETLREWEAGKSTAKPPTANLGLPDRCSAAVLMARVHGAFDETAAILRVALR